MENVNTNYEFLNSDLAGKYFTDLDIALRQGRHIQDFGSDTRIFSFVEEFYNRGLKDFYKNICQMRLMKASNDTCYYYFLDFPEDGKGKFGKDNRSKELEDDKVIFGILFLNVYKEKFFEQKEMTWQELDQIFKEGENKDLWQQLLYAKVKPNYTPTEEQSVKDKVKGIIRDFEKLGWVAIKDIESVHFEILPSIDRLTRLYDDIISNPKPIDQFLKNDRLS
jgi:chromosome condensin MukBEF MukE localization factor